MAGQAFAQNLADMSFELLDEEDGLSSHWLRDIALDSSGYLWVGTRDGLNRYDGYHFKTFRHDPDNPTSILNDYGQMPYIDKKGRLWIGYLDGGISLFKDSCQCFQHFLPVAGDTAKLPKASIAIYYVDEEDNIWFSGQGLGLNKFNPASGKAIRYNLPNIDKRYPEEAKINYNSVTDLYADPDRLFWLTSLNGLYTFKPRTSEFSYIQYDSIIIGKQRSDGFNSIIPAGNKGFWLSAYGGGIHYFDKSTASFTNYRYHLHNLETSLGNVVSEVQWKNAGELWVNTEDKGFGVFNIANRQFTFLTESQIAAAGLSKSSSYKIVTSPDQVIFLLTVDGLLKYNSFAKLFNFRKLFLTDVPNKDAFHISKIIEDPTAHAIYFAMQFANGLNVLDTRTNKLTSYQVDVNPADIEWLMLINDLLLDQQGRLWVLARDFLYEYDKINKRLLKVSAPPKLSGYEELVNFKSIYNDPDGDIWVLTNQGTLHQFFPAEKRLSSRLNDGGDAPERIDYIEWDKHGRMWVQGGGKICIYDKLKGRFNWLLSPETQAFSIGNVRNMVADKEGNIWLAIITKGLLKIDVQNPENPVPTFYNDQNGLPTTRIFGMNSDHDGNIWMSTILGVVYMHPSDLSYRIFTQTVGMDKNTISMRFIKDPNGAFYIATPGQYCRVDFDAVKRKVPVPKVYIDKFSIFNKEQPGRLTTDGSPVILQPGEDFFSFEFGCLDFTNQALNKFAYMLEGWDEDWVQAGTRRFASYTNLDGGEYVFKVKAANSEGVWSDPVSMPIIIETPFYQKTWFAVLAALLVAGVIYGLYRFRVRQIENTERMKTEFNRQLAETRLASLRAQMNPHFIFNSLNSINRYIIKSDIKTSSLYLTRFAKLMRLILDNSEHKKVVLANEIEALRLYVDMEALRFEHKFTFDVGIDPAVDADNIEIPPLLLQPYVENAIWHGLLHKESGGHLSVRVWQENGNLICDITDNGIGRQKAMEFKSLNAPTRKSIGMKLTEERLQIGADGFAARGSQEIIDLFDENGVPCGTKVVLTIPL